ncbi:hypothetical protein EJB05_37310, partial [Eragrostis curvula]
MANFPVDANPFIAPEMVLDPAGLNKKPQGEPHMGDGPSWTVPIYVLNWEEYNNVPIDMDAIPEDGNPHPLEWQSSSFGMRIAVHIKSCPHRS